MLCVLCPICALYEKRCRGGGFSLDNTLYPFILIIMENVYKAIISHENPTDSKEIGVGARCSVPLQNCLIIAVRRPLLQCRRDFLVPILENAEVGAYGYTSLQFGRLNESPLQGAQQVGARCPVPLQDINNGY